MGLKMKRFYKNGWFWITAISVYLLLIFIYTIIISPEYTRTKDLLPIIPVYLLMLGYEHFGENEFLATRWIFAVVTALIVVFGEFVSFLKG